MTVEVIFFHGAGEGAYEADAALAASLSRHLGDGFSMRFPRLPEDDDPGDRRWLGVVREAIERSTAPVVLVGHSAGGYLLLKYLAGEPVARPIAAVCIIAAPFPGGSPEWTFDGFELPDDLADRLPRDAIVLLYASEDDDIVPFAHRDCYAAAVPAATTRTTSGGHQLADDLAAVADDIRSLPLGR